MGVGQEKSDSFKLLSDIYKDVDAHREARRTMLTVLAESCPCFCTTIPEVHPRQECVRATIRMLVADDNDTTNDRETHE